MVLAGECRLSGDCPPAENGARESLGWLSAAEVGVAKLTRPRFGFNLAQPVAGIKGLWEGKGERVWYRLHVKTAFEPNMTSTIRPADCRFALQSGHSGQLSSDSMQTCYRRTVGKELRCGLNVDGIGHLANSTSVFQDSWKSMINNQSHVQAPKLLLPINLTGLFLGGPNVRNG